MDKIETSFKKKGVLFTLIAITFIDYMSIGLVYPLFTSLVFDQKTGFFPPGTSDAFRGLVLGVLFSLMPLVQFFSAPIIGFLSDRKGRKTLLLVTLTIGLIAYCISVAGVHSKSLSLLIISRILLGVSGGSAAIVQAVFADISNEEEKSSYFSLFNMALGAGLTVGPFVGGKFSDPSFFSMGSYELPFWFASVIICINILLVLFFLEETKQVENNFTPIELISGMRHIQEALYLPGLRILFVCAFIFSFGWSFFIEFVPVYMMGKYAFRSPDIGTFYAYSSGVYALSCGVLIRPIIKHVSSYHVLFFGLLFCGSYVLGFLFIDSAVYVCVYFPFLLFLVALIFPTLTTMISQEAMQNSQGKTLGILQSVQSMAFAISPLFSGPLVGLYPFMPIVIGSFSMLAASAVFGCFFSVKKSIEKP